MKRHQSSDGKIEINVQLENDTIWLTQAQMVSLFDSSKANISEQIKHIIDVGELETEATVRNFRTVRLEGNREVARSNSILLSRITPL